MKNICPFLFGDGKEGKVYTLFKRMIAFLLAIVISGLIPLSYTFAENDCSTGETRARMDVMKYHSTGGYGVGGFGCGILLGLIGTGIIWAAASGADPSPATIEKISQTHSSNFTNCYMLTYREETKRKNKSAAVTGGLLGTATILIIILSASQ